MGYRAKALSGLTGIWLIYSSVAIAANPCLPVSSSLTASNPAANVAAKYLGPDFGGMSKYALPGYIDQKGCSALIAKTQQGIEAFIKSHPEFKSASPQAPELKASQESSGGDFCLISIRGGNFIQNGLFPTLHTAQDEDPARASNVLLKSGSFWISMDPPASTPLPGSKVIARFYGKDAIHPSDQVSSVAVALGTDVIVDDGSPTGKRVANYPNDKPVLEVAQQGNLKEGSSVFLVGSGASRTVSVHEVFSNGSFTIDSAENLIKPHDVKIFASQAAYDKSVRDQTAAQKTCDATRTRWIAQHPRSSQSVSGSGSGSTCDSAFQAAADDANRNCQCDVGCGSEAGVVHYTPSREGGCTNRSDDELNPSFVQNVSVYCECNW